MCDLHILSRSVSCEIPLHRKDSRLVESYSGINGDENSHLFIVRGQTASEFDDLKEVSYYKSFRDFHLHCLSVIFSVFMRFMLRLIRKKMKIQTKMYENRK